MLGIGGVRALRALGLEPDVFHTNEGHAGFLGLERIRELVADGLPFAAAVEAVRGGGVFTTHTPVPAGIDRFPRALMEPYFTDVRRASAASRSTSCSTLGERADEPDDKFNMAVMGLRLAARSNGVARLHGAVSRRDVPRAVARPRRRRGADRLDHQRRARPHVGRRHASTRCSPASSARTGPAPTPSAGRGSATSTRSRRGRRSTTAATSSSASPASASARTSSTRPSLTDRLRPPLRHLQAGDAAAVGPRPPAARCCIDADRPVQFVFAGKAHPADTPGKELIQQIEQFARQADVRHRFVFLADYDISIARAMYHGCDVWLNTPRRPLEACGTSGMKAALNGALNCSILDGWWDECYDGTNGWAIESAEDDPDLDRRDLREAGSLFAILENQVVPQFYDRGRDGVPRAVGRRWCCRPGRRSARRSPRRGWCATTRPRCTSRRPRRRVHLAADGGAAGGRAGGLAPARRRRRGTASPSRRSTSTTSDAAGRRDPRRARSRVELGGLTADDVRVEVVHGPLGHDGEFRDRRPIAELQPTGGGTLHRRDRRSASPAPTACRRACSRSTPTSPARSTSAASPGLSRRRALLWSDSAPSVAR